MPDEAKLQKLIDRQEILDCLTRYCRGIDRFDRDILLSAYHPDAIDDHGMFVGSPADFADSMFNGHNFGQKKTFHVIANHTCEIEGDTAHAETYCIYYGYNRDETIDVASNRYIDRLEKRNGEWRIAARICVLEGFGSLKNLAETNSVIKDLMPALMNNAVTGRHRDDISYARPLKVVREPRMPPLLPDPEAP